MSIDPDEVKERIRRMTDIVELIGEQTPLRQQGRLFVGLCPWHEDSHPSLKVDPERQNWKCWVCNLSGDCYEYIMRREGMTFPEAKRYLADRAGILLPEQSRGPRATPGSPEDKNTLYQAMAWAVEQYHRFLLHSSQAQVARDYLSRRQISAASIERFQIGFAPPEWTWLLQPGEENDFLAGRSGSRWIGGDQRANGSLLRCVPRPRPVSHSGCTESTCGTGWTATRGTGGREREVRQVY